MARRTWWIASLAGAIVAAASGPGLLAAVGDSAASVGNTLTSGTFDEPSSDLRLLSSNGRAGDCPSDPAAYDDGPTAPMQLSSETFDLAGGMTEQLGSFCLLNASDGAAALAVSFESVSEHELGQCEPSEADAGDTTCEDGAAGELASVIGVEIVKHGPDCASASTTFVELHAAQQPIGDVRAGKACSVSLRLRPVGDDRARQQAQTDRVTWDIRFHLEPAD